MSSSYVVETFEPLAGTIRTWMDIISEACGAWRINVDNRLQRVNIHWEKPVPGSMCDGLPTISYRKNLLSILAGQEWDRIRWFYYCDRDQGNTLRLYDEQFFARHRELFLEDINSGSEGNYPDRVIVRGENLGGTKDRVKTLLLASWRERVWPAAGAPIAANFEDEKRYDLIRCAGCRDWSRKRHEYFQHERRNCLGNGESDWCCSQPNCVCSNCKDGFNTPDAAIYRSGSALLNYPFRDLRIEQMRKALERETARRNALLPPLLTYLRTCPQEVVERIAKDISWLGGEIAKPEEVSRLLDLLVDIFSAAPVSRDGHAAVPEVEPKRST